MRVILSVVLTFSLAGATFAQRGGHGGGGGTHGGGGGFSHAGAVSRGGGVSRGGFSGGAFRGNTFAGGAFHGGSFHGGVFNNGFRGGNGVRNGFRGGFRRFGPRFYGYYGWPYGYGYPLNYWDPFWDDSYTTTTSYPSYSYSAAPSYYNAYPDYNAYPAPAQSPGPLTVYESPAPQQFEPGRTNEPVSFLLAFKDHNIKIALAYWTEKSDLRYVTMEHEIKTVPLNSIDRDLSLQLNRERRVTFTLPMMGG